MQFNPVKQLLYASNLAKDRGNNTTKLAADEFDPLSMMMSGEPDPFGVNAPLVHTARLCLFLDVDIN